MVASFVHYRDEILSWEGGLWLALMDALLIIPLGMAAFFYPVGALLVFAAVVAVTGGGMWWGARRRLRLH